MRTDVSEALDRVIEALAGASEEEVVAVLATVGSLPRQRLASLAALPGTPLPAPGGASEICSEVERVSGL